ncbi:MFS transporter [Streptomyces sp. NPDC059352]|uniref:MFS transporter n=1 Tax=Streptomyces sp. NPDC059352 TaxID=3346810 RepID=UPI0036767CDB
MSLHHATAQAAPASGSVPEVHAARRGLSIAVVLTGVFVSSLDLFIVNIAFPELARSFPDSTFGDLSWVLSAYAIAFAALLMPAGSWADRSGRKRAFIAGFVLFTAASAACAFAPSLGALVAARIAQAVGGALMMPSSLGLMLPLFPAEKRGAAIGLWAAMGGAAAAAGPPVGGLLVQADWRWVFLVNLPLGLVAVLVAWRVLPEIRDSSRSAPDVTGALVLAATIAAVVAAIVQGEVWGWDSVRVLALAGSGAVGLAYSVRRILRHPSPVVEPAVLRIRSVAFGDLATLLFFSGFGAMILGSTLFLTQVWGHSVLRAGMEIAPGPLMAAVCAVPGGILASRYGARWVGFAGSVLFAVGGVWWAAATAVGPDYASAFLPAGIVAGIGSGLVLPSLSGAATLPLPPERFATGTALMSMCRQVGLALGVAVVAAVLGARPALAEFHTTWLFMAGCGLAGGLAMLLIGTDRGPAPAPAPAPASARP